MNARWLARAAAKALAVLLVLIAAPAWAHKPSDAHLRLDVHGDRITGLRKTKPDV